jgi:hypothetical protein
MMAELRTRPSRVGGRRQMYDPQSSWPELADFRKIQEEITRSIASAVQFYIKTNVYSIIAWLFLIVATNYFLVFPSSSGGALGAGARYKVMEYTIAVTMVIIGLILNASAWSDLRDKGKRLEALRIATYDLARELGTRDIVEREWHILGDMTFIGRKDRNFVHSLQFIWFLLIHLGLAVVLILI